MGTVFIFRRSHAAVLFEHPGKILGIFEGKRPGDLGEIQFSLPDQLLCPLHLFLPGKGPEARAGVLPEQAAQEALAVAESPADILHPNGLLSADCEIFLDRRNQRLLLRSLGDQRPVGGFCCGAEQIDQQLLQIILDELLAAKGGGCRSSG